MTTTTTTTTTPMTSSVADSNDLAVPDSDEFRFVGLGAPVTEDDAARRDDLQKHFSSNSVRNTKYRWYSLVPKSLWNQFRRLANVYFLIMSVAMMVGNYTEAYDAPIEGINTLVTLLITMLVTMAIEAKDDCERAKKDREINGTETVRLHAGLDLLRMDAKHPAHRPWRPKHFRDPALGGEAIVQWKDVVVGDLVLVFKDETFPADVLLLASDAPDSSCFIETKSIDGETNLKKRRPAEGLAGLSGQHSAEAMASSPTKGAGAESRTGPYHVPSPCEAANAFLAGSGYLRCEHPNVHVDENPGELYLKIDNSKLKHSQAGTNMLNSQFQIQNTILRGCQLRNTAWALGVAMYTGKETKVAMNTKPTPSKLSTLDKLLNRALAVLMGGLVVLTVVSDGLALWWRGEFFHLSPNVVNGSTTCGDVNTSCEPAYLFPVNQPFDNYLLPPWLAYFFTFAILYSNFVPIVLYVLVEILNSWLAALVAQDVDMWDPVSGEAAFVRSTNLVQELGQIEYVFSDKTGTITKNKMLFKGWSVCTEGEGGHSAASRTVDPAFDPALKSAHADEAGSKSGKTFDKGNTIELGSDDDGDSASEGGRTLRAASSGVGVAVRESDPIFTMLRQRFSELKASSSQAAAAELHRMQQLLVVMSVAHTVVIAPHIRDDGDDAPPSLDTDCDDLDKFLARFQSASPDELCLVEAAARLGMVYRGTIHGCVVVEITNGDLLRSSTPRVTSSEGKRGANVGTEAKAREPDGEKDSKRPTQRRFRVFKLLVTTKFNSTRKRMSVVVQEMLPRCHATTFPRGTLDGMNVAAIEWGAPVVLCKGADNVILDRSKFASKSSGSRSDGAGRPTTPMVERSTSFREVSSLAGNKNIRDDIRELNGHLDDFSRSGLRTLVFAQRELSSSEWSAWEKRLTEALATNTVEGEKLEDAQAVHLRMGEELEGAFEIVGASAIDDELQDNVGATIKALRRADIKVWVLTGDKLETAISIGLSCDIIDSDMSLLELSHRSLGLDDHFASLAELRASGHFEAAKAGIDHHLTQAVLKIHEVWQYFATTKTIYRDPELGRLLEDAWQSLLPHQRNQSVDKHNPLVKAITTDKIDNVGMVVTGKLLDIIMTDHELRQKLLVVSVLCTSVIACRVSPLQKADIVRLVQQGLHRNPVTLAIGDGANDVTMIQQAQVGVGISGVEGLQAANASDFSIAQFQFLYVLMMKHGRWNYRRLAKVVLFFYYKNMLLPFTVFFYSMYTGFSGTTLYDSYTMQLYNIVFTTPPILAIGAFDIDVSFNIMRKFPELYECGRINSDLNNRKMATQLIFSIIHSLAIFGWPRLLLLAMNTGNNNSIQFLGACTFTNLVMTVNFRAFMLTYSWNDINTCFSIVTVVFVFIFLALYSFLYFLQPEFYWVGLRVMSEPVYWLSLVCCLLSVCIVDYGSELFRLQFYPSLMDLGRLLDRRERRENARAAAKHIAKKSSGASKRGGGNGVELTPMARASSSGSNASAVIVDEAEGKQPEDWETARRGKPCNGGCVKDPRTKLLLAPLFQQLAPTWNPVVTPSSAPAFFALAGLGFLIVGVSTLAAALQVVTYKIVYSATDAVAAGNINARSFEGGYDVALHMPCPTGCACLLQIPLLVEFPADADILVAFELGDEFHQNYFRYSRNRSFAQLRGFPESLDADWGEVFESDDDDDVGEDRDRKDYSKYFRECGVSNFIELPEVAKPLDELAVENFTTYYPCGLIAGTFFADSAEIVLPNSTSSIPATTTGDLVNVTVGEVDLDKSSLAWQSDDYIYQRPEWWNPTLTYEECIENDTPPAKCIDGRPAKFRYIYDQPAVRNSPYFARRLFERGIEDPHLRNWLRSSGLGPTWKHFGTLAGGLAGLSSFAPLRDFVKLDAGGACARVASGRYDANGYCIVQPVGLGLIPAGTKMLEVALVSSFEVDSFDGSKTLVLTTTSTLGNLQESVAFPCIIIGALSLVVATSWFILQRTACTTGDGPCRFEALVAKRLSAKQKRTMKLHNVNQIARAIKSSS